jgi:hypothetical protein
MESSSAARIDEHGSRVSCVDQIARIHRRQGAREPPVLGVALGSHRGVNLLARSVMESSRQHDDAVDEPAKVLCRDTGASTSCVKRPTVAADGSLQ